MNRQGSLESLKTSMKAHRADFIRALAMERSQACIMYLLFTFRLRRIWCSEFCLGNFLLSKNIALYSCEWSSKLLWSPWRRRRATKLQAPHWSSHQERTPEDLQIWWCLSWGMSGPNLFVNRKCNVFPRCFVMLTIPLPLSATASYSKGSSLTENTNMDADKGRLTCSKL